MILCDTEIRATLANGQILVLPTPPDEHITTSALDLTLDGGEFKRWKAPQPGIDITVDPSQPGFYRHLSQHFLESVPVENDGSVIITPGSLLLALTHERVELPEQARLAARVEGRSSLARIGLGVHVTAPTIHSGFRGKITLEITNHGVFPIKLRPGMRICQLIFEQVFGTPSAVMTGIFQDQHSVSGQSGNA
jgi:dCTP deaminase